MQVSSSNTELTVAERNRLTDRWELMATSAAGMAFLAIRFLFGQFLFGEITAFIILGFALFGAFVSGRSPGVRAPSLKAVVAVVVTQLIGFFVLMVTLFLEYHHRINHITSWGPFFSSLALAPAFAGFVLFYNRWNKERGGSGIF